MNAEPRKTDESMLLEFMLRLGQAYLACGEQTAKVELTLRRAASAYGVRRSRVVAFPTAIMISIHEGPEERVTFTEGPTQSLRLDQIADVYNLGEDAQHARMTPAEGLERLHAILRKAPRFGVVGTVLGNAILAIGVSMFFVPSPVNLLSAAVLAAAVGLVKALDRTRPLLAVPLPVLSATLVSALVFLAVEKGVPVDPLHVIVPPLVSFLPGAMLCLGMVELAYGDMVSGSSRLMTGFVQLVLLVFGLAAGTAIVGYSPERLTDSAPIYAEPPAWIPWLGVLVFGSGAYLHFSAPRRSFFWMLLALLVAFGTQQLAAQWFGDRGTGFFGMLVATPLGYLIQLRFKGPPAMVTFLPCFWLLVPGALGLLSVTRMLSDRDAGIEGLTTTIFVFTSTAVGTLVGASIYKWLTETFGWWQLQIGRVGRYFRDRKPS